MIITCPCGEKKFEVAENLIPEKGRLLKCGSCNETWFFNKNSNEKKTDLFSEIDTPSQSLKRKKFDKPKKKFTSTIKNNPNQLSDDKNFEIVKYQSKVRFSFSKLLSYILTLIISLIALIIILDTFKSQLYVYFPNLEFFLFSFYETLKDIGLFLKDLIKT